MNALRVSVTIIWLAAAVSVVAFAQSALGLFIDSDAVGSNTFATASCFPGDTGFLDPSAEAADSGGDGNGFEGSPTNAFADDAAFASNIDGAGDRHRYYNYGVSVSGCDIVGIEVQLDWYLDDTLGTNDMDVELSWDGGTSWTAAKTDTVASTSEHTTVLGGASDTWGHSWTVSELSDANFRVRLTSNSTDSLRDFFLDWVPVKVHLVSKLVSILDAWTTGTTHAVSAGSERLLLVGVYAEASGSVSSINTVTWGGQTLTEINEEPTGNKNLVWLGYLNEAGIAAASGTTIVATWSGSTPGSVLYAAVTLEDVDQTTPVGGNSTGSANQASVQIASALSVDNGDMAVYVVVTAAQGNTHTPDTGYVEGTEEDSGGSGQVASNATKAITASGSEQPTATWSGTANKVAIIGAVINVAP